MTAPVAIFWLVVAFLAFIGAMAAVFAVCVRERRRQEPFAAANTTSADFDQSSPSVAENNLAIAWRSPKTGRLQPSAIDNTSLKTDAQSDNQVALVIFGGIIFGAFLAIAVGYVVFFSGLT